MAKRLVLIFLCFLATMIAAASISVPSTHPRVLLRSEPHRCPENKLTACDRPWTMGDYMDRTGVWRTYHYASSSANQPDSQHARSLQFTFRGSTIKVFGAPRLQLSRFRLEPGQIELCIEGACQLIDTADKYWGADDDLPVLLWSYAGFRQEHEHVLEMRLMDTSAAGQAVKVMTVQTIEYDDDNTGPQQGCQLLDDEEAFNTTYYDTNPAVSYTSRGASEDYPHWTQQTFLLASPNNPTFHTIPLPNESSDPTATASASFTFRGIALYVYGASKNQLEQISADRSINPAQLTICVDNFCHGIDAYQLYLNGGDQDASEPMLLWLQRWATVPDSYRRVWLRYDTATSTLGFDGRSHMTLNRFVVTEGRKKSLRLSSEPQVAEMIKSDSPQVAFMSGTVTGSSDSWTLEQYTSLNGTEESYMRISSHNASGRLPAWSLSFTGSDIRVYGAAPLLLQRHQNWAVSQEICLDGTCFPVDIAHACFTADDKDRPILLWSSDRLDLSTAHTVMMRMLESSGTMTLHHVTYSSSRQRNQYRAHG